ncbi:hypothetical protein GZ77_04580 [Endozoicomonas montiporae]|uniref:Uncharacterized protein n=1 Tax=Endozoicomonas montiporae TaxID=1027273 RepID=A0A081NBI9_9GAMM|nr:hypothetical protein GZ77_04580 [Endozoicomonas montiporae]
MKNEPDTLAEANWKIIPTPVWAKTEVYYWMTTYGTVTKSDLLPYSFLRDFQVSERKRLLGI